MNNQREKRLRYGRRIKTLLLAMTIPLALLSPAAVAHDGPQNAQNHHPDKPKPKPEPLPNDDRFQKVLLEGTDLTQPMRMSVASDGRVIYIERDGRVKVWDPKTQQSVVAGTVPVRVTGEFGLIGLALAPDFAKSGHVYLHFSRPDWDTTYMARVARYTLSRDNVLDSNSAKTVIDIQHPKGVGGGHSAGDLLMTKRGHLFIATGDNTNCCASRGFPGTDERPGQAEGDAQRTSANTNDLNGKILRIIPKQNGGYTVPKENLFPEKADPGDKTRPEIYAMGFRNPFTLGDYDEKTGALWMADYGPDAVQADPERGPAGHVRVVLVTGAGNYGWPYCTMDNQPYNDWNYVDDKPGPWFDCDKPVNDSPNNTGLVNLPPIKPATVYYTYDKQEYFPGLYGGGAMAGPTYHFDKKSKSATKFPQWFDNRRFLYDWTTDWVQTTAFEEKPGKAPRGKDKELVPTDMREFLPDLDFHKPMDMEFGPDGSLYVLEYGTGWGSSNDDAGIHRIDYIEGNRAPAPEVTSSADSGALPLSVDFDASKSTDPDGDTLTYAWDFNGDGTTDATSPSASFTYTEAGSFQPQVTVTDAQGSSTTEHLSVIAGNTRPRVTVESPADGGFSEFGEDIAFKVKVEDPEDGAVDCTRVKVTYQLGHNLHGHPMAEAQPDANCEGVLKPGRDAEHGPGAYVFHVVQAEYTDGGGPGGAPSLSGESDIVLHPSEYTASTYQRGEGVGLYTGQLFVPDSGNWFMFPRVNLGGIDQLTTEFATRKAGVNFTVHADSPDGPVVATYENIPHTGSTSLSDRVYKSFTAPITDPGGTHDLYFVGDWPTGLQPELFVRNLTFG